MPRQVPTAPTHYRVLGVPAPPHAPPPSPSVLRAAYRHALLSHHPDKSSRCVVPADPVSRAPSLDKPAVAAAAAAVDAAAFSIDQIKAAYAVLSHPGLRAEYDRGLLLLRRDHPGGSDRGPAADSAGPSVAGAGFRTGIEVVDLAEMAWDARAAAWSRGCRCGDPRGFSVGEAELEEAAAAAEKEAEVDVGCRGCSLWLKVLFSVEEAAEDVV